MDQEKRGATRRETLECMLWAGAGLVWTVVGGVPKSILVSEAKAEDLKGFSFLQISDSHIGFDKAANPDTLATLRASVAKAKSLSADPAFMIHTGDITHLSTPAQFSDAQGAISEAGLDVHYVPGEHDVADEGRGKLYLDRHGKGTQGAGWYSFDHSGVHFVGLVNVVELGKGGLGHLGDVQLKWLEADLAGRSASTPVVVFAHMPLWAIYPQWGWGTDDSGRALALLKRFGSVTVLNGHIHQVLQKVEGAVRFHTARSTAFPQPAPGSAPAPGPMAVPAGTLGAHLGVARIDVVAGKGELAIVDATLA